MPDVPDEKTLSPPSILKHLQEDPNLAQETCLKCFARSGELDEWYLAVMRRKTMKSWWARSGMQLLPGILGRALLTCPGLLLGRR